MSSGEDRDMEQSTKMSLWKRFAIAAAVAVPTLGGLGWVAQKDIIPSLVAKEKCGVRVRDNQVVDTKGECMKPGLYLVRAYMDSMYGIAKNTIILDLTAGGQKNTKDQNDLTVGLRFHYKNNLKSGNVIFHIEDMARDDGKALLTTLINQAVDSAAGYDLAVDTLKDPRKFLFILADNLDWRLRQNTVAIEIDAIEVNVMQSGGLRTPVQLRMTLGKDGKSWNLENITGPSTIQPVGAALAGSAPR